MSGTLKEVIEPVQYELEELMETEYGLLTKLFLSGVITNRHQVAVKVIYFFLFSRKVQILRLSALQCLFLRVRKMDDFNKNHSCQKKL